MIKKECKKCKEILIEELQKKNRECKKLLKYNDKQLKFVIIQEIAEYSGINDIQTKALIKIIRNLWPNKKKI